MLPSPGSLEPPLPKFISPPDDLFPLGPVVPSLSFFFFFLRLTPSSSLSSRSPPFLQDIIALPDEDDELGGLPRRFSLCFLWGFSFESAGLLSPPSLGLRPCRTSRFPRPSVPLFGVPLDPPVCLSALRLFSNSKES